MRFTEQLAAHRLLTGVGVTGVGLTLLGLSVDIAYHVVADAPSLTPACCGPGFVGHLLTLAGMVVALSWVVGVALATRRDVDERRT